MYKKLLIETSSMCNRTCPTCLRNSYPDRQFVESWFKPNFMSLETITEILDQAKVLGYNWHVNLNFYNEPLLDPRIIDIAKMVKLYGFHVQFVTNGDFLMPRIASELDRILDCIHISVYENKAEKKLHFETLMPNTKTYVKTHGHSHTHYSPKAELRSAKCLSSLKQRLIINHKGEYMLCCEDFGSFDLGKFSDISLKDFWHGEKRNTIISDIVNGNRNKYEYCKTCPKR